MEIVETLLDARQIADTVAVAVLERTRINLVNDTVLPPDGICHGCPLIAISPSSW
jgi:hypothetical protein